MNQTLFPNLDDLRAEPVPVQAWKKFVKSGLARDLLTGRVRVKVGGAA